MKKIMNKAENFVDEMIGGSLVYNLGKLITVAGNLRRTTMQYPRQLVRRTTLVLLAFGLILGILPGCTGAQDKSAKSPVYDKLSAGAIVPLDGPVLVGKSVTFKLSGNPDNPYWKLGDGATADGSSVTHTYQEPGIYRIVMGSKTGETVNDLSSAIVRVHTPETLHLPQVFLDTDARNEVDDQHYIAYGLFSNLDVLGITSIHNVSRPDNGRSEQRNYDEILNIIQLSRRSGLLKHRKENQIPQVFRGANVPLEVPASGKWSDTQPVKSEAVEAILAAARGASPDNPVWVLPVGPGTNVASAILQAREEGLDLKSRIKIVWLGGTQERVTNNFNGNNDPWSVYVTGQSDVEFWIIPARPTGVSILFDKRYESELYPDNPLGEYLKEITPASSKALLDLVTISMVISNHLAKIETEDEISRPAPLPWHGVHWLTYVVHSEILGPDQGYLFREVDRVRFRARFQEEWQLVDSPTNVRIVHDVDEEAMKADFFNTLNGKPTALPPK